MRFLVFFLFFVSGSAGLVYEVAWARSLGVVFGASHLAVTTVLSVYMGGQALGAALIGARADRTERPLRLYGLLELGIGVSALAFVGLMRIYPALYVPLARVAEESPLYLTVVRTTFAALAIIVPTTLMGGTLPTLSRFFAAREGGLARQLSLLYGFNTLGAVVGALLAGFVLLPGLGVTATLLVAAGVSITAGAASVLLQRGESLAKASPLEPAAADGPEAADAGRARPDGFAARLTLLGIGLSGFCALGYEVLWTRMLTLVVGTSVYSFTVMLVAFLVGIALGSYAFGPVRRLFGGERHAGVLVFGCIQVLIGVSALAVTVLMRDLPLTAGHTRALLAGLELTRFAERVGSSFGIAFTYLLIPSFLMGLAFPVAGAVWSAGRSRTGAAVGRLLTANTVGAILGSATTGFALIYLFGIERSLQMLILVNVTCGVAIALSASRRRWPVAAVAALGAALVVARGAVPSWGRVWDQKFFATFSNMRRTVDDPERAKARLDDAEVLYYHEGVDETVSVIRARGDIQQTFIVNGRPEASNAPIDVQLQRALGHLPMLLHRNPRSVFVLGTGSGMTLGATSIHPEVERIVLAEIEKGVLGVARTFSEWNAHVLDDPRLHIVFNDGRNHLASTRRKFDVITSDPIHPWSGGAAYLYTVEYFRTVAGHLAPGGMVSQWLPLYELSTGDVRTVLRTFSEAFPYVQVWLTYYDAVLIGSNEPILVDESELERRLANPRIRDDLAAVHMGSVRDLLAYFVLGDAGAREFARGGEVNTDDNLTLEFSAPLSQGALTAGGNVLALTAARESLVPYLAGSPAAGLRRAAVDRWTRDLETARLFDLAHAQYLAGEQTSPGFADLLATVRVRDPGYAPLLFLLDEAQFEDRRQPVVVAETSLDLRDESGAPTRVRLAAIRTFLGRGRVLVSFADLGGREVWAKRIVCGRYEQLEDETAQYASRILGAARAAASEGAATADAVREVLRREANRGACQLEL
ncbi:fused MFS/spermidine synthase [Anaeromyxobacter dehalogenans]|uniref:Polyamine aminopropyltransferase n=1 Tax=Anaeromyxobacter dehalogenans (strain 2CP-C) TaxID=290397 RepID=Q2IE22_ANADE|nr:fused MFS/spermidine synthase [Anaeromyxobacter dehalogenans]ABC82831.1 Spermine synthase [Anaeromyxobacter dehalogenans 2CP-C]